MSKIYITDGNTLTNLWNIDDGVTLSYYLDNFDVAVTDVVEQEILSGANRPYWTYFNDLFNKSNYPGYSGPKIDIISTDLLDEYEKIRNNGGKAKDLGEKSMAEVYNSDENKYSLVSDEKNFIKSSKINDGRPGDPLNSDAVEGGPEIVNNLLDQGKITVEDYINARTHYSNMDSPTKDPVYRNRFKTNEQLDIQEVWDTKEGKYDYLPKGQDIPKWDIKVNPDNASIPNEPDHVSGEPASEPLADVVKQLFEKLQKALGNDVGELKLPSNAALSALERFLP